MQSISAPWQHGDFSASPVWAHPEIEWVIADGPSPGTWLGVDGLLEGWRDFLGAWEDWRAEVEEYRELDDERVLVLFHFTARGKSSGLQAGEIRTQGANLFHVRDDKVTRLVLYWDYRNALTELDLEDEAGPPA